MYVFLATLCSLITASFFLGALAYGLFFWWLLTNYRRWERYYFRFFFWPIQITSGLIYLFRMAWNSFLRHGRRPIFVLGGWYQLGETFEWKHKIFDEDIQYRSHRMPLYFDWWTNLQNPVLIDTWMEEQNRSLYFRWGSFFRYFFLLMTYGLRSLFGVVQGALSLFFGSEYGHSFLVFIFYLCRLGLQLFSYVVWIVSRAWSRFTYALAGEHHLMRMFVFACLDKILRFQWYQKGNVDLSNSPDKVFQRPPTLRFLRYLWFGITRFFGVEYSIWPLATRLPSLLALFFLGFLLLPFLLFSSMVFGGLGLFTWLNRISYSSLRWKIDSLLGVFLAFPRSIFLFFFALGFLSYQIPARLLFIFRVFWHSFCRWAPFVLAVLCLCFLATGDFQSLFRFGLGFIFVDFFQQAFSHFFPLVALVVEPLNENFSVETLYELKVDWYDEVVYQLKTSYFGGWYQGWPTRKQPSTAIRWWDQPGHEWWWTRPIGDVIVWSQYREFFFFFHDLLYEYWTTAKAEQAEMESLAAEWWTLVLDPQNVLDLMWRIPFHGIYYTIMSRYYSFLYRKFCTHYSFYWLNFAYYRAPYGLTLALVTFGYLTFIWPFSIFFGFLGSLGEYFWWISFILARLGHYFQWFCQVLRSSLWFFYEQLLCALLWPFLISLCGFLGKVLCHLFYLFFAWSHLGIVFDKWPLWEFLWAFPFRWLYWYVSLLLWEFCQLSFWCDTFKFLYYSPVHMVFRRFCWALYCSYGPVSPAFSGGGRNFSAWTLGLTLYLNFQYLLDSICIYVQFPRNLDDYTVFSLTRRLRQTHLFLNDYTTIHKGSFFTGHRWALSPIILYRYAASEAETLYGTSQFPADYLGPLTAARWLPSCFAGSFQETTPSLVAESILALPFVLVDAYRVFLTFAPLLYFVGLSLLLATFSGAATLLFGGSDEGYPTSSVFNRQWAWEKCRQDQSLETLERLFFFETTADLIDLGIVFHGPEQRKSRRLFRRLEALALGQQPHLPSDLRRVQQQWSLGSGHSYLLDQLLSRRGFITPFAEFLLKSRYDHFRHNVLEYGDRFSLFLAYTYSKNPWVNLSWNQYEDGDYTYWLHDASLSFAQRTVEASQALRDLLNHSNRTVFQNKLGDWLWSKDLGNFEFQKVSDPSLWGHLSYEVDDKDADAFVPWGVAYWLLFCPFFLYLNLYIQLESSWSDFPFQTMAGTSELRRQFLFDYSIYGHFFFFYQQVDMRGWDLLPEWQKTDSPVAPGHEIPTVGYPGDWHRGYTNAYYPVALRWPYRSYRWPLFLGTHQPYGLLEEYCLFRRGLLLFLGLTFFWALGRPLQERPSGARTLALLLRDRWSIARQRISSAKAVFLWFWK